MTKEEITQEMPTIIKTKVSNIIRSDKFNCRSKLTKERIEEIAKSIRQKGLVNPPIVREGKDGQYELVAGFTRVAAVESIAGKDADIAVRVMTFETEEDAMMVNALENTARTDLLRYDLARLVHKLVSKVGLQQAKVASNLGLSQGWVSQLVKVWEGLSNPVKEWWAGFQDPDKQPQFSDIQKMSKETPADQKKMLEALLKGEDVGSATNGEGNGDGAEGKKKRTMKDIRAKLDSFESKKEENKLTDEETIAYNVLRWVTGDVKSLSLKV